jgi:hypothetical protein
MLPVIIYAAVLVGSLILTVVEGVSGNLSGAVTGGVFFAVLAGLGVYVASRMNVQ